MSVGEIERFETGSKKTIPELLRTFVRLKALIRTNFTEEGRNQLFVTLTYKENNVDREQLYKDFEKFMKRLRYKYSDHKLDYIAVAEPQARGMWYLRVMLKSDKPILYIDNKNLESIWRKGMTETECLKADVTGQYYVTYFTNMLSEKNEKKGQKNNRLGLYPPKFKFYRTSRGIEQPEISVEEWQEVQKMYGKPLYKVTCRVISFDDGMETVKERPIQTKRKASFRERT